MKPPLRALRALLAGLALGLGVAVPASADAVIFRGGQKPRQNVTVTKETCQTVVFKSGGADAPEAPPVKAEEVVNVVYADAPDEFKVAETFRSGKRWAEAAAAYEKALGKKGVRDWLPVYAKFYLGECCRIMGEGDPASLDKAIGAYREVLQLKPDSRFLPEARYYLAACLREKRDFSGADAELRTLDGEVSKYGLPKVWGVKTQMAAAESLEKQGKWNEAEAKWGALARSAGAEFSAEANVAQMRQGLCMVEQQKYDAARSHFEGLVRQSKDTEWDVRAGAHLGLGKCWFQQKDFKKARFALLQVDALYGMADVHAEALFWAGRANMQLEETEPQARQAARLLFTAVLVRHPSSTWSKKAQKELEGLGGPLWGVRPK
ncbi:MAG: tetratricopeptide repeat protein [Planctomycetales bacterium]|nr:tetratricopeptide repeat protein [Planctomycetales bacterium]